MCLVFRVWYLAKKRMTYPYSGSPFTKHQILNTLVKSQLFRSFTRTQIFIFHYSFRASPDYSLPKIKVPAAFLDILYLDDQFAVFHTAG